LGAREEKHQLARAHACKKTIRVDAKVGTKLE